MSIMVKETDRQQHFSLREWQRRCPVISPEMSCGELADLFRQHMELECVVACDERKRPQGLVMKHRFFRMLGSKYGMSLFGDKAVDLLAGREFLQADVGMDPRGLIDAALSRDDESFYDVAVLTDKGRFAGILTVRDLLEISRMLQRESADRQIATVCKAESMIEDIRRSVDKVMEATEASREAGDRIAGMTAKGRADLEGMLRLFRRWSDHTVRQETAMRQLTERAAAAGQIASLIADLADQCNLLALNASVESARAGEHGRGFGIVAGRIRELADGTKRSAGEINRLLRTVSQAVDTAADMAREGKSGADQGVVQVRQAEMTFRGLWEAAERGGQATVRLKAASQEAVGIVGGIREEMVRLLEQMARHPS